MQEQVWLSYMKWFLLRTSLYVQSASILGNSFIIRNYQYVILACFSCSHPLFTFSYLRYFFFYIYTYAKFYFYFEGWLWPKFSWKVSCTYFFQKPLLKRSLFSKQDHTLNAWQTCFTFLPLPNFQVMLPYFSY